MFERFTEKSIKVIRLAQEESRRLGHNFIDTHMFLLGLIEEETGNAARILQNAGINLADARDEVERTIGLGNEVIPDEIPFTSSAKSLLERSLEECRLAKGSDIETQHILLGLIRGDKNNGAIKVLKNLGIDLKELLDMVLQAEIDQETTS
jgi:ATP-dependent Clp protease ATP-binding subunit ClpC